jgi:transcriptional regulator of arginine metabolism
MKKPQKVSILFALRQLLLEGKVSTQIGICAALQDRGFAVNQSKISRLLTKIAAIKVVDSEGQNIYRLPHEHGLSHEYTDGAAKRGGRQWVLDMVDNGVLIVIHTSPGAAALIAREIDMHQLKLNILGCIAGDDTIFIAPKDIKAIQGVKEGIIALLDL